MIRINMKFVPMMFLFAFAFALSASAQNESLFGQDHSGHEAAAPKTTEQTNAAPKAGPAADEDDTESIF